MKPLHERNQVLVAIWGTLIAGALVLAAMNLDVLPFVNPTNTYYADFENAAGIKTGDDVRVQGISVGQVQSVAVQGDHVHVGFTTQDNIALSGSSRASIELATVLGNLFLQVESAGPGHLRDGGTIPVSRTTVPFSLLAALQSFGRFSRKTNIPTLRTSLRTLATTVSGIAPKDVRTALDGLSQISTTLASKQDEITGILRSVNTITDTLNRNSGALLGLLTQGDEFLRMVEDRHRVISQLLRDTARLGTQLDTLMRRSGAKLGAVLANLATVTKVLVKQRKDLQSGIVNLGQFSVNIANVNGSGPWLDLLTPTSVVPDNQIVGCGKNVATDTQKPCNE